MSSQVKPRRIIQIWPFFVFFGMGSSISFVYAGVKHKMRNLVVLGVVYGLAFALAIAISEPTGGTAEEFSDTSGGIILLIWVVSTVHAFRVNKKHRMSLLGQLPLDEVREVSTLSPGATPTSSFESLSVGYFSGQDQLKETSNTNMVSAVPVDVNSADLQTLLARLSLSPESAERVLLDRQTAGGFQRVDEFVRSAGLKPHEFAKIRNLVEVVPRTQTELPTNEFESRPSSGRVLDL
jgi:DNA uptake protein ComE-like DNA-binding protein